MKKADGTAANRAKLEHLEKDNTGINPDELSFQQNEERALVRTEVLKTILAREERPSWRHWGLNE